MKKEASRLESADNPIFEGMSSVRAVLTAWRDGISDRRIIRLIVDEAKAGDRAKELGWLSHQSEELGFPIEYVPSDELAGKAIGTTHGGILAECSGRTLPGLADFRKKPDGFYVMLEGIEDPYNFGYAIRSLYACGADGIILSPRNWMSAAGVVCRSSAGASELLPIAVSEPTEAASSFRKDGFRILCAGIRDSVSSFDCSMKKPLFLVVGGEKRGISAALLKEADEIVRIDYGRTFAGSLSAASAASMLAYEVMRQNRSDD